MITKLKQCARRLGSWPSLFAATGHYASVASLSRGLFAALTAVFMFSVNSAHAAWTYNTDDGRLYHTGAPAWIMDANHSGTDVTIADIYDKPAASPTALPLNEPITSPADYKIVAIGNSAFSGNNCVTNVALPDSLRTIGTNAFQHCDHLTTLTIPAGVNTLGTGVFMNNPALESVIFDGPIPAIPAGTSDTYQSTPNVVTYIQSANLTTWQSSSFVSGDISAGTGEFQGRPIRVLGTYVVQIVNPASTRADTTLPDADSVGAFGTRLENAVQAAGGLLPPAIMLATLATGSLAADAYIVNLPVSSSSYSQNDSLALSKLFASDKPVLVIGENSTWNTSNNQVAGLLDGVSCNYNLPNDGNSQQFLASHSILTTNFALNTSLDSFWAVPGGMTLNPGSTAVSFTEYGSMVLGGANDNVLALLDCSVFEGSMSDSKSIFADNICEWLLAGPLVPSTTTAVTLDMQSGTGGTPSITITTGAAMPSATAPIRANYIFQGYFSAVNGGGVKYYNSNMSSARTWDNPGSTLYAHWVGVSTSVTLNMQSGTGGTSSITAFYGVAMPSATAPTRANYVFQGYFSATGGNGVKYYNADMTSARTWDNPGSTLYAYWTSPVTLNMQDGTGGTASISAIIGAAMPSATAPTRANYIFQGYFSATGGNGIKYYNADMTSARIWDNPGSTLYAHWVGVSFTVTLDKQNGTGGTSSVVITYDAPMPPATEPSRDGYTFGGYYTEPNGEGNQCYSEDMSSVTQWRNAGVTTIYAKWTPIVPAGTFSDVATQLYAKYDATDELWNGPQIVATFTPTTALPANWPAGVTVMLSLSGPPSGDLTGRLEYIDGAWRVVAGNNIPSGIIHLGYSPDKAHHLSLTVTVGTNTATFSKSVMVNYHPKVTETDTTVAEGMSNARLGFYSPNEWEYYDVWEKLHPLPDSGHFIENRLTNGTPVTVIVGAGGTRIDAWLDELSWNPTSIGPSSNYWNSVIIGNIPKGLSGTGLSATYYFGGIDNPSWVYNGAITIQERDSYAFTLFPQVIYAELLNQYAGTYKPEPHAGTDWAARQTIVVLNNQYKLDARLVPLGDGTARIILNEALDASAVSSSQYSLTNCVVLEGNPVTISDPPNQIGSSTTFVRGYNKPVIDLNDTLNPDTDNPDGDEVIGTFTPPANGGYDGDVLPLNGEIPVLFKIYRYNGNAPAGEDPDSAYVDTEYKGYVVNRGDATGYRICLIDPLPIIPPGTWYLGIATDESRLAVGATSRSFGRYEFTVDMARISLTGAVTAQETGPVLIGTYTPNPDYGFGDWTTFAVVITIDGTDYAGYIDSARNVYINDANFANLAPGSYTIGVMARGLFADGEFYDVAFTESRVPFGEEEPDGDDGIDVIDPDVGAGLTITAIRVYKDGDGREWVDIDVTGCKNYSKDYALFGRDELIAKAAHDMDDEIRSDGLTVSELSTGVPLRYAPSKVEIIGLGTLLPATNADGAWTFTFPKPANEHHFYHVREVPR